VENKNQMNTHNHNESLKIFNSSDYIALEKAIIFKNIASDELQNLLQCLSAVKKKYSKGEYIFNAGDMMTQMGVVIKGSVDIVQEDALGRKTIITTIKKSGVFGEGIVAAKLEESPVSIVASEQVEILFLQYISMVAKCEKNCVFHTRLIENMLELMSKKIIMLNSKLNYALLKTIREKIFSYLIEIYGRKKTKTFEIDYNREELANYFSIDRSSLSRELSQMREEGLIDFKKNKFILNELFFQQASLR